jgi:hypothetical protein
MESSVAVTKNVPGKCARCGRALKRTFVIDGQAYGPVCVRKMGYQILTDGKSVRPLPPPLPDSGQKLFFTSESDVVYQGVIVGDDTDRTIYARRGDGRSYALSLDQSLLFVNHSPTGFSWGYGGSGPAQLSFAILYDYFGEDLERARSLYMDFKFQVVARLDMNSGFTLDSKTIENAITSIEVERMRR